MSCRLVAWRGVSCLSFGKHPSRSVLPFRGPIRIHGEMASQRAGLLQPCCSSWLNRRLMRQQCSGSRGFCSLADRLIGGSFEWKPLFSSFLFCRETCMPCSCPHCIQSRVAVSPFPPSFPFGLRNMPSFRTVVRQVGTCIVCCLRLDTSLDRSDFVCEIELVASICGELVLHAVAFSLGRVLEGRSTQQWQRVSLRSRVKSAFTMVYRSHTLPNCLEDTPSRCS